MCVQGSQPESQAAREAQEKADAKIAKVNETLANELSGESSKAKVDGSYAYQQDAYDSEAVGQDVDPPLDAAAGE